MTDVGMFLLIEAESRGVGAAARGLPQLRAMATCPEPGKWLGNARETLLDPGTPPLTSTSQESPVRLPSPVPHLSERMGSRVQPRG